MTATANLAQALGGGPPATETSDVPIEHLDYEYINKCSSGKELEQILRVLRFVKVFGVVLVYSCFVFLTLVLSWSILILSCLLLFCLDLFLFCLVCSCSTLVSFFLL